MIFLNKIQQLLKARSVSCYRFWRETGFAQNTAYRIYNEPTYVPGPELMSTICEVYQVKLETIIDTHLDESSHMVLESVPVPTRGEHGRDFEKWPSIVNPCKIERLLVCQLVDVERNAEVRDKVCALGLLPGNRGILFETGRLHWYSGGGGWRNTLDFRDWLCGHGLLDKTSLHFCPQLVYQRLHSAFKFDESWLLEGHSSFSNLVEERFETWKKDGEAQNLALQFRQSTRTVSVCP